MTFNEKLRQQDILEAQKAYQEQDKNIHIDWEVCNWLFY